MTKLTRHEKETIINFNEGEKEAYIFTYNKKWQRHLETVMLLKPTETNDVGGKTYILPKDRIRLPQPKRKLSDKQKKQLADRLRNLQNNPNDKNILEDENRIAS